MSDDASNVGFWHLADILLVDLDVR
jgi:hypothetical protein